MTTTLRVLQLAALLHSARSHGAMQYPPTWLDPSDGGGRPCGWGATCFNAGVMYFTNNTQIRTEPTILDGSYLRTYSKGMGTGYPGSGGTNVTLNPWRAPGSAHVWSPCGINGGNPFGCPAGDINSRGKQCPGGGTGWGEDAVADVALQKRATTTEVAAGSVLEVGWGIRANHGGGYSYRLCRSDPTRPPGEYLSEKCFQDMPLAFVGEEQYVQFGEDKSTRVAFRANRTSEGTTPRGSQWTKNPIPACGNAGGGSSAPNGSHCGFLEGGTQFPSPVLNPTTGSPLEGFCESSATGFMKSECPFSIVDRVQLPADLQPGEWVLGFRWDCEQTPQVWTTCSNLRVSKAAAAAVAGASAA